MECVTSRGRVVWCGVVLCCVVWCCVVLCCVVAVCSMMPVLGWLCIYHCLFVFFFSISVFIYLFIYLFIYFIYFFILFIYLFLLELNSYVMISVWLKIGEEKMIRRGKGEEKKDRKLLYENYLPFLFPFFLMFFFLMRFFDHV